MVMSVYGEMHMAEAMVMLPCFIMASILARIRVVQHIRVEVLFFL